MNNVLFYVCTFWVNVRLVRVMHFWAGGCFSMFKPVSTTVRGVEKERSIKEDWTKTDEQGCQGFSLNAQSKQEQGRKGRKRAEKSVSLVYF